MAEETNTNYGRIVYFEPNELFGGDNQPVNQEELIKYFNLSVRIPSRFYNESVLRRNYESVLKGTPFVEKDNNGNELTKLYLTDNYVNMSYTEFGRNGEISSGELFGIESINISFDVQFQPIVVINFTDVKGFGLMSTMEYNYSEGKINNLTAKSFFTSLFNFPYPMFTLEVKGYYGKSVSIDLAVKDFHTSFDSNSGNFKTTVTFIGYLYGVYADIPMSLIMISPLIDFKGDLNNNSILKGDTWKSLADPTIPTYFEFIDKYRNLLSYNDDNNDNFKQLKARENLLEKNAVLEEVKGKLENIKNICETQLSNLVFIENVEFPDRFKIENKTEDNSDKPLLINHNNFHIPGQYVCYFIDSSTGRFEEHLDEYQELIDFLTEKNLLENYDLVYEEFKLSHSNNLYSRYFKINNLYLGLDYLNQKINSNQGQIDQLVNRENVSVALTSEVLGFRPTIKNMYKILFKHIDCFSKIFYNTIKNIKNRTLNSSTLPSGVITDVNDNNDDENYIPPFPMIGVNVNGKFEIKYPGIYECFQQEPEIIMVENIYNSLRYFTNKINNNYELLLGANEEVGVGVNANIKRGNFIVDIDESVPISSKNYFTISPEDNKENIKTSIKRIYAERFATFCKTHMDSNCTYQNFNEIEANLFYNALKNLDVEIIKTFKNFTSDNGFKELFSSEIRKQNEGNVSPGITIKNSEIENQFKILKEGTYNSCKAFFDSFEFIGDFKTRTYEWEPTVFTKQEDLPYFYEDSSPTWYRTGTKKHDTLTAFDVDACYLRDTQTVQEGYRFNNYKSFIGLIITSKACGDLSNAGDYTYTNLGNKYYQKIEYLDRSSIFFNDNDSNLGNGESRLLRWLCSQYDKKTDTATYCGHKNIEPSDGPDACELKAHVHHWNGGSYESSVTQINDSNRIMMLSLAHLLALAEVSENAYNESYFIPATIDSYLSQTEDVSVTYAKYFKIENDVIKDLFKNLNEEFESLKNGVSVNGSFFEIPSYVNSYEKASEYWYVIGKETIKNNNNNVSTVKFEEAWNDFVDNLFELYNIADTVVEQAKQTEEKEKEISELKTNIYYILKNLYDKWYCALPTNFFDMNKNDGINDISEFNKIKYLTTTYNDISDELIVNVEYFTKQILNIKNDPNEASKSVLSYMAKIAQDNQSTFITLPTNIFNENIKDAFKTFNFYNGSVEHEVYGATYIVMHNGDVSHNLDIKDSQFKQDGYMIADYRGNQTTINDEAKLVMEISSEHDYVVQAFGVTYGMQNQNYFKNINIDTQTPQLTDYSIANILNIAESASETANGSEIFIKHQSLYPVYANRSYNCSVEMVGCMNITPLMYFQLNNIPMFKGAYMITNVEHQITPNDFTTIFTGVRVSKYKIPINKEAINISRIGSLIETRRPHYNDGETSTTVAEDLGSVISVENISNKDLNLVSIDPNKEYWFPYNGITGRTLDNGNIIYGCGKDCMDSVRKSIGMIISKSYNGSCDLAADYTSSSYVVQLLYEKYDDTLKGGNDYNLYYEESGSDKGIQYNKTDKYKNCIQYIINMIDNGHPVCVGVAHSVKRPNVTTGYTGFWLNDGITDHYLCIYAYAKDGDDVYFKFYESGSNIPANCASDNNILVYSYDNNKPKFYCSKSNRFTTHDGNKRYDVSQVRINKNFNNFLTDYSKLVGVQRNANTVGDRNPFVGDDICVTRSEENRYLYQKGIF